MVSVCISPTVQYLSAVLRPMYKCVVVHGYMCVWVSRYYMGVWLHRCMGEWVHG